MITIKEHTIEESIIDKNGWVLDLVCVNFQFSLEIKKYCNNVICVDPNPNITQVPEGLIHENAALTHDETLTEQTYFLYDDTNGNSLLNPSNDICNLHGQKKVNLTTIKKLMLKYNIDKFELIKFDIEGSEYKILEELDWGVSKQFSVEFHDFRGMNPYYPNNEFFYSNLFEKIKNNFDIITHVNTHHPGFPWGEGFNYWDSLFVEKNSFKKN
jgi:FkbM family methyltransferase